MTIRLALLAAVAAAAFIGAVLVAREPVPAPLPLATASAPAVSPVVLTMPV